MRRRIAVALVSGALSIFGLVISAGPASASCIDTGIPGVKCINPCPPGPWYCTQ